MSLSSIARKVLAPYFVEAAASRPSPKTLSRMRQVCRMQLFADELQLIVAAIQRHPQCKLLVFGLGNDSAFWAKINRSGRTVFLEDNQDWFEAVTRSTPALEAHLVKYSTRLENWRELLDNPDACHMNLPAGIGDQQWDVIFVDAPAGFDDDAPGRMQSIYLASKLAKSGGDVFVHDCHREVERTFSSRLLGDDNLVTTLGTLRHFRVHDSVAVNK